MEEYSDSEAREEPVGRFGRATSVGDIAGALGKHRRVRHLGALERLLLNLRPAERLALYILSGLLALSAFGLLIGLSDSVSVSVPAQGGSLTEGEVGPARFINPLLANSQADQDLTALVYSGLMRELPDGSIVPDLAQSYTISPDGRTYTFVLRANATFQNGTPVTASDVLYTVQLAQDPSINSPRQADWEGVVASSTDAHTVVFTLPHAYAPFLEDTTLGILPKSLWQSISDEEFPFSPLNTHPVGSGPYEIAKVTTDSTGAATRYDLVPFKRFALGEPYISRISFIFYPDDTSMLDGLNSGSINAVAAVDPSQLPSITRTGLSLAAMPLPRVFGVFLNQNQSTVLADSSVRAALNAAVDPQSIVQSVLGGYGASLSGPIPPGLLGTVAPASPQSFVLEKASASSTVESADIEQARSLLQKGGWSFASSTGQWTKGTKTKETLSFTLSTADDPELVATANALVADWKAAGIDVTLQVYPLSELNLSVIRPRQYDALLFGEVVGPQLDLYAFWHSSQRNDPGLNLSMYANSQTDALLTQARATSDPEARDKLYEQFASLLSKDDPAVFLYAPDFLYVVPSNVHGIEIGSLSTPADRFENVYQWYADTQQVWTYFAPQYASQTSY